MELWQTVGLAIAVIVIIAAIGWLVYTRKRSEHLRERFGPEYDRRVVELEGDRSRAEKELKEREARIHRLTLHPLSNTDRIEFVNQWRKCQAKFVDDPAGAVSDADVLLTDILHARGYTTQDRDERLADFCAAYPQRAFDFREANESFIKHRRGIASTEDLRRAFLHFRTLSDEMLGGLDEELKRAS